MSPYSILRKIELNQPKSDILSLLRELMFQVFKLHESNKLLIFILRKGILNNFEKLSSGLF